MIDFASTSTLLIGLFLGLMHAFESDHLLAVSTLAQGQSSTREYIAYGGQWALGHGGVLFLIGILALGFGIELPENLVFFAEKFVGVMLIFIGAWLLFRIFNSNWQNHWKARNPFNSNSSLYVGMIHGLAGSTSVVALIPVMENHTFWFGISYLVLFSVGVLLSMSFAVVLLHRFQRYLSGSSLQRALSSHMSKELSVETIWCSIISFISIILGVVWLSR